MSPRLFSDLRTALAYLYSTPLGNHQAAMNLSSSHQAHEFLLNFQSRNVRRKIQSLQQSAKDQKRNHLDITNGNSQNVEMMGSSWLACLYLLVNDAANSAERLFAAQTLLIRTRRTKLSDAIDWEMEIPHDLTDDQLLQFIEHVEMESLGNAYKEFGEYLHPQVSMIVKSHQLTKRDDEECLKGEFSLLTLTVITLMTAISPNRDHNTYPLLSTLSSIIATIALRLCYSQSYSTQATNTVAIVVHALDRTWSHVSNDSHFPNFRSIMLLCLTVIPEVVLGGAGGARGRLSIDPKVVQAAAFSLRKEGLAEVMNVMTRIHAIDDLSGVLLLSKTWIKFVPMPVEFIRETMPIVKHCLDQDGTNEQKMALSYLIAIFEGADLSVEDILQSLVGISSDLPKNQQGTKKHQSSRSKKRQQEKLENETTDELLELAESEAEHRGGLACQATALVWGSLRGSVRRYLAHISESNSQVDGEGPIGALASCANACLPHLLRNPSEDAKLLFKMISDGFHEICESRSREGRALCYEPIFKLHKTLVAEMRENGKPNFDSAFQHDIVEHFYKCGLAISRSCCYPNDYFYEMTKSSDEDLEIERNDVRDVLRTISGSDEGGSTMCAESARPPFQISLRILAKLVEYFTQSINKSCDQNTLPDEVDLHSLSAMAKPLNHLSKMFHQLQDISDRDQIVESVVSCIGSTASQLVRCLTDLNVRDLPNILPVSRVFEIGLASLSPFFNALCSNREKTASRLYDDLCNTVKLSIEASALSIASIPELASESILGQNFYDIRGTMRGPGGEDHVGVLALMRFSSESNDLARLLVPYVPDLCRLYKQLKHCETLRKSDYGLGVCPKSRRILLETLCNIENIMSGQAGGSEMLQTLFNGAVNDIYTLDISAIDSRSMHLVAETTLDLCCFPSNIISSLFMGNAKVVENLVHSVVIGYDLKSAFDDFLIQWNRHRVALYTLVKKANYQDIPPELTDRIVNLIHTECDSIHQQCMKGPESLSAIFNDEIISMDSTPSGLFVKIIDVILDDESRFREGIPNTLAVVNQSSAKVLSTLLLTCSDPSGFSDPRPCMMEAWLCSMCRLCRYMSNDPGIAISAGTALVESVAHAICLLMYPTLPYGRPSIGMNLDGPHSLMLMDFLGNYFVLGLDMLRHAARCLTHRIRLDYYDGSTDRQGFIIIAAALFRAVQGALPPWAVESLPFVYSAFFIALEKNVDIFGDVIRNSMTARLSMDHNPGFGGIQPGELISGPHFASMSEASKTKFIEQICDLARKDNVESWRRLKVCVKAACGGKKKESNCKQKPSLTKWDMDRI